jgi:heme o synthase
MNPSSSPATPPSFRRDLSALVKPRITLLVVLTTVVGYFLAAPRIDAAILIHTLVGTALLAAASSVLNQVIERRVDALMVRTRERPLPAGRMSPAAALLLGVALSLVGMAELYFFVNLLTAALGAATLALYVFAYTPLKQYTSLATLVGAVPGAMPPMMGVSAAVDGLPLVAWLLFGLLFLWQMPHFLAIAWLYRDDYERGGLPMLSVGDADGRTARQAVLYAATIVPLSLLPNVLGMTGIYYFLGAILMGFTFVWGSLQFSRSLAMQEARRLLVISVIYLPVVLGLMVLDARGPV